MGKTTGFLEFKREDESYAPVEERIKKLQGVHTTLDRRCCKRSRCKMYELWYPFLSQWLSSGQLDTRL